MPSAHASNDAIQITGEMGRAMTLTPSDALRIAGEILTTAWMTEEEIITHDELPIVPPMTWRDAAQFAVQLDDAALAVLRGREEASAQASDTEDATILAHEFGGES